MVCLNQLIQTGLRIAKPGAAFFFFQMQRVLWTVVNTAID